MTQAEAERRSTKRVSFPCEARCYGVGESLLDAHLTDVSTAGAFVKTVTTVPAGTVVLLKFKAGGQRIKVEAEVAHRDAERGGLGLRFLNLGPAEKATLKQIEDH